MKLLLLLAINLGLGVTGYAQILDKIENEAKNRKDRKEDEIIDEGFDKIENIFKRKDNNKDKEEEKDEGQQDQNENKENDREDQTEQTSTSGSDERDDIVIWTEKYDFVPGEEIIFYDDFEDEALGDIPVQWSYEKGMLEIVELSGAGKVLSGDMSSHPN
jgi:OOP family OmpA-OmpF porin